MLSSVWPSDTSEVTTTTSIPKPAPPRRTGGSMFLAMTVCPSLTNAGRRRVRLHGRPSLDQKLAASSNPGCAATATRSGGSGRRKTAASGPS